MGVKFVNYTPHAIDLNDGTQYPSVGIARVASHHTDFDENGVCDVVYGDITGLPDPQPNTYYIVSMLVLDAAKAQGRTDCVAPASGHPGTVRKDGFIVSVPGFIR